MKHTLLLLVLFTAFITGCEKKTDEIFEKSADERIQESLAAYQQALVNATYGWKLTIFPKGLQSQGINVGGFSFYMRFTNDNRVTMFSDFSKETAGTPKESGYRLKAVQRPSIYFDTYGYVHIPSDPAAAVSRTPSGSDGTGWGSDFDFSFLEAKPAGDTIRLKGNFNGSDALLIKATQQEATAYNNRQLANSMTLLQNLNLIGYFKLLTIGSVKYYITVDEANKLVVFSWLDGSGNIRSFSTGYYSTLTGIMFTEPFNTGTTVIPGINFITWNAGTQTMNVSINNTNGTISNAGRPLKIDVNAPQRWWQTFYGQDTYWISVNGFTVNGVQDAFKIRSIPNFYYLGFWSFFGTSSGVNYDLLGFIKINEERTSLVLPYGSAYFSPPEFTSDGRVVFSWLGTLGTVPSDENTPYQNTSVQMEDPEGYYLIPTGPGKYDMVSRNGQAWITWQQ